MILFRIVSISLSYHLTHNETVSNVLLISFIFIFFLSALQVDLIFFLLLIAVAIFVQFLVSWLCKQIGSTHFIFVNTPLYNKDISNQLKKLKTNKKRDVLSIEMFPLTTLCRQKCITTKTRNEVLIDELLEVQKHLRDDCLYVLSTNTIVRKLIKKSNLSILYEQEQKKHSYKKERIYLMDHIDNPKHKAFSTKSSKRKPHRNRTHLLIIQKL